ncbi:MAG: hypothetical protein IJR69_08670, partial [Bacteroidaceae bacterium]|nr:hypothetical protein [Bacteroidaceae bacterium]
KVTSKREINKINLNLFFYPSESNFGEANVTSKREINKINLNLFFYPSESNFGEANVTHIFLRNIFVVPIYFIFLQREASLLWPYG